MPSRRDLPSHPLADLFPAATADELRRLAADIKANGQLEPIELLGGAILDGRNRYAACRLAGVEPVCQPFTGSDPLAYVLSRNLHRRHLSESQRAMIAATVANMQRGRPAANPPIGGFSRPVSQARAAELLNTSEKTVERAARVHRTGTPELKAAVVNGTVPVSAAAEVASLPAADQAELVAAGPAAVRAKARELRGRPAEAGRLLATQPKLADADIAARTGCDPAVVAGLRAELVAAGGLPHRPPAGGVTLTALARVVRQAADRADAVAPAADFGRRLRAVARDMRTHPGG